MNPIIMSGTRNKADISADGTAFTLTEQMERTKDVPVICAGFLAGQGVKAQGIGWELDMSPTLRGGRTINPF